MTREDYEALQRLPKRQWTPQVRLQDDSHAQIDVLVCEVWQGRRLGEAVDAFLAAWDAGEVGLTEIGERIEALRKARGQVGRHRAGR